MTDENASGIIWAERRLCNGTDLIFERQIINGQPPADFKPYRCSLHRPTGLVDPKNGQPLMAQANVEFDADSPEAAFAALEELKSEFAKQVKQQSAAIMLSAPPPPGFDPKSLKNDLKLHR